MGHIRCLQKSLKTSRISDRPGEWTSDVYFDAGPSALGRRLVGVVSLHYAATATIFLLVLDRPSKNSKGRLGDPYAFIKPVRRIMLGSTPHAHGSVPD